MKRVTILTSLLILGSTWIFILVQAFIARQIVHDMVSAYEFSGLSLPPLSQPSIYFLLSSFVYILPALASKALILAEIIVKSERSRFIIQVVYTCLWLGFIIINHMALFLPIWKMQTIAS